MLRFKESGSFWTKLAQMRMPLMALLLVASICAATLLFGTVNTFTVSDGKNTQKIHTLSSDIDDAITVAGFSSDKYKVLSVNAVDNITNIS